VTYIYPWIKLNILSLMKADAHIKGRELIVMTARVQIKSIHQGIKKKQQQFCQYLFGHSFTLIRQ